MWASLKVAPKRLYCTKMSALTKVFVYGTLKRGEPNHHWLTKKENGFSRFVTVATTLEKFPLVVGTRYNIPFLLDRPGHGHCIEGEVYEVDNNMMANLDILEDYPSYYDREQRQVKGEDNELYECWLYLIRKFPEKLLEKKLLRSYRNGPEQPYWERSRREENVKAKDDMEYNASD